MCSVKFEMRRGGEDHKGGYRHGEEENKQQQTICHRQYFIKTLPNYLAPEETKKIVEDKNKVSQLAVED